MKVKSKLFYWYAALVAAFTLLSLLPAPDKAAMVKYHLSAAAIRGLEFTLIIPEAIIWYAAFYGYEKLRNYSRAIEPGKESTPIRKLATGLLLLAIGLPFNAIAGGILSIIASHSPSFTPASVVIKNYINVLFPLAAFLWISMGARGLSELTKSRPRLRMLNAVALIVISLGVVFCCLIVLDHVELRNTYHMSPELVMLTLGIPYMYVWFLGLFGLAELHEYTKKLTGIVYKKGWKLLISGLASIILLSIGLEYLTTASSWLTSLSLSGILLLLYVLLLLLGAAYIVLALGAKKLMKIEEA